MRREEGTGAMPLWGAGSELEFRLRFVRNGREDPECTLPAVVSPAPYPTAGRRVAAGRAGRRGARRLRGGRWAAPHCPEDKGGIRAHL